MGHYGLNAVTSGNSTKHAEIIAITEYLEKSGRSDLSGFTIYTTLEPCIMCGGMMTMTGVRRVVYGQNDVDFSKGLERLAIDTSSHGGYPPYVRKVVVHQSESCHSKRLNEAYRKY